MENLRRNGTSTEERPVLTESLTQPPRVNSTRWKNRLVSAIAGLGVGVGILGVLTFNDLEKFALSASVILGSLIMSGVGIHYNQTNLPQP